MSRTFLLRAARGAPVTDADDDSPDLLELAGQSLPSWLASLVVHLTLVLLLALLQVVGTGVLSGDDIVLDVQSSGDDGQWDAVFEAAMATPSELAAESIAPPASEPLEIESDIAELLPPLELGEVAGASIESISAALDEAGAPAGKHSDDDDDPEGAPLGLARTGVFGLVAEGTTFVYVFDHSESMNSTFAYMSEGTTEFSITPLDAAKAELLKSLDDLDGQQKFQILFYNHEPWLFDLGRNWRKLIIATPRNKQRAADFVATVRGQGTTNHLRPLEIALRMRPDVIFLLTDGEAKDDPTPGQLAYVRRINRSDTRINVIQFCLVPRSNTSLVRLAAENGGQHVFMNIARLAPPTFLGP